MHSDSDKQRYFREIFNKYSRLVYSVAYSYMKNSADANDVMQEAFLKYYSSMDTLSDEAHIKPWLITVTSNICKNNLRSSWFTRTVSTEDCPELTYDQDFGEESDLFRAVMKLPEKERIPIHLFYYEGCSTAEISKMLKIKESTIRVRMMRGRKKLQMILKEESV